MSFEPPAPADGADLWLLACDAQSLDVNSRYSYLLWCRDFAATSVVARSGGESRRDQGAERGADRQRSVTHVDGTSPDSGRIAGFITGYRRPDAADTLFVWQVAVAPDHRRQGLARSMLDHLVARLTPQGVRFVEATVTPDNKASTRLFESFANANDADCSRDTLFSEQMLGGEHAAEILFRIGPLAAA